MESIWDDLRKVVWNMFFLFHSVGNFIIPTDEDILLRGVGIPPTTNSENLDGDDRDDHDNHWTVILRSFNQQQLCVFLVFFSFPMISMNDQ